MPDSQLLGDLLHGEETHVRGDSACWIEKLLYEKAQSRSAQEAAVFATRLERSR